MIMFEALEGMITILKSKITLVNVNNVYNYEPGANMLDYKKMPSIFCYDNESDFQISEMDIEGTQTHEPTYYIDIYVSSGAKDSAGIITNSAEKAHDELRAIISEIYNILMWQRFIPELTKIVYINKAYISRIEKLGVTELKESHQTAVAQRLFFKIQLEETPPGDDGLPFESGTDKILSELKT